MAPTPTSTEPVGPYGLHRLPFELPSFTRVSWTSDEARRVWEPRISRMRAAWREMEWRSVHAGLRRCVTRTMDAAEYERRSVELAVEGLATLPLELLGPDGAPVPEAGPEPDGSQPHMYTVVIAEPDEAAGFLAAWKRADEAAIGEALGCPTCCRDLYHEVWVENGLTDTTWPMALNSAEPGQVHELARVIGPPVNNVLWRWLDLRVVPHLPCRFDCEESARIGEGYLKVGRGAGFEQEVELFLELLSWPVEWSALHGIAEIKTPVLKVSTRTDATAKRYAVQRPGDRYPEEGAEGLRFPYRMQRHPLVSWSDSFQRGLANPIAAPAREESVVTEE